MMGKLKDIRIINIFGLYNYVVDFNCMFELVFKYV